MMMRRILVAGPLTLVALAIAPAFAGAELAKAGTALRTDPVYVAPNASPTITKAEADQLRSSIRAGTVPVFIAVLPESAVGEAGNVDNLPRELRDATKKDGAYGVIAGRNFRAASSLNIGLDAGEAGRLATQAFESNHPANNGNRVYPMLADWADRVQQAVAAGKSQSSGGYQDAPPGGYQDAPTEGFQDAPPDFRAVPGGENNPAFEQRPGYPFDVYEDVGFGFNPLWIVLGVGGIGILSIMFRAAAGSEYSGLHSGRPGIWPMHRRSGHSGAPPERSPFDSSSNVGGGSWGSGGSIGGGGMSSGDSGSSGSGGFDSPGSSGGGSW